MILRWYKVRYMAPGKNTYMMMSAKSLFPISEDRLYRMARARVAAREKVCSPNDIGLISVKRL